MRRLAASLIWSICVWGQTVEPEMTADRPGFRNSTHLVGPGVVQFESGATLSSDHFVTVQPEVRIGVVSWLEFRVNADRVVARRPPGESAAGTSDLQPGVKFPVFNARPGTRVVAILKSTVPTGHGSQTSGGYEPGAELVWEHKITDDFSLAGTWNLARLKQERFVWQRSASIASNVSLSERLRTFAEVYVVSPSEARSGNQWAVDAGLMRVVGNYLMLDFAAGHSVHGPREWFVSAGLSVRTRVPGFHPRTH